MNRAVYLTPDKEKQWQSKSSHALLWLYGDHHDHLFSLHHLWRQLCWSITEQPKLHDIKHLWDFKTPPHSIWIHLKRLKLLPMCSHSFHDLSIFEESELQPKQRMSLLWKFPFVWICSHLICSHLCLLKFFFVKMITVVNNRAWLILLKRQNFYSAFIHNFFKVIHFLNNWHHGTIQKLGEMSSFASKNDSK